MAETVEQESFFPRDPLYYVYLFVRQRTSFLIAFAVVFLVGVAWVVLQPRVYASDAKLLLTAASGAEATRPEERLEVARQRVLSRQNLIWLAEKYRLFPQASDLPRDALAGLMRQRVNIFPENTASRGPSAPLAVVVSCEGPSPQVARDVTSDVVAMLVSEDVRARKMDAIAARLRSMRAELAQKEQVYTETHPVVRALRDQVAGLDSQLKAESAGEPSPDEAMVGNPPAAGPLQGAAQDRIEVIDAPAVPQYPIRPSRRKLLLFVLAAAFGTGAAAAFAREKIGSPQVQNARTELAARLFASAHGKRYHSE